MAVLLEDERLIAIPLDIPDVRVLQTELTKAGELLLTIESTLPSTTGRRCRRTITERHGEALPATTIVLDRLHVLRHARDGVDSLRTQELRRLKKELPKDAAEELKHTLWPFRKRPEALDD